MMPVIADVIAPLERLFQILFAASIAGGVVILATAALCRFTSRIAPATRCALWWLAALKLIVALVWIEPVVLRVLPIEDGSTARLQPGSGSVRLQSDQAGNAARLEAGQPTNLSWRAVAASLWIAGTLAGLGVMFNRVRRTARMVSRADPVDAEIQRAVRELCLRAGVSRSVGARWSGDIDAPMVAGLLRPVILLPAGLFDALPLAEQRMAICHELVHLGRGDLWLGCVPALAERLFFFHPLAILAAREYLLAREAACDRAVLRLLNVAPHDYGRLLLALGVSPLRAGLAAAGSSRSFSNLKRRIAMLGHRSPSFLARIGGWLVAGAAACALIPIQLAARPTSMPLVVSPPHLKPWPWAAKAEDAAAAASGPAASIAEAGSNASADAQQKEAADHKDRLEFVLVNRDRHGVTMSGSWQEAKRLKRLYGDERVLWFRYDGKEYVVKDAAAIDEAEQINRPVAAIGAKQGEIGAKQGAVGAKQGAVGAKQGEIGARQGAIGAKQGHIGAQQAALAARQLARLSDAEQREIEAEHERLAKEMALLNEEMAKLSEEMQRASEPMDEFNDEMRELSKEMDVLSGQMNEAVAKANREMIALVERLIKDGLAKVEP
jgi:beta-lactamase regulating signal transducer with metallopeptidase domain